MEHLDSSCPKGMNWHRLVSSRRGLTRTSEPKLHRSKHTVCENALSENVIRCATSVSRQAQDLHPWANAIENHRNVGGRELD